MNINRVAVRPLFCKLNEYNGPSIVYDGIVSEWSKKYIMDNLTSASIALIVNMSHGNMLI